MQLPSCVVILVKLPDEKPSEESGGFIIYVLKTSGS
jgi:hypothetical protein